MKPSDFKSLIRETIRQHRVTKYSMNETISKSDLKLVIKEALRAILKEMPRKKKKEEVDEMTTTSAVEPINLPGNVRGGWISKQGGSPRAIKASTGYELTSIGKKDFNKEKQDPV
jgi:hypothetical protein